MANFWKSHLKLRNGLIYAAKNAINAVIGTIPAGYFAPNKFNFSSLPGVTHILIICATVIVVREALIWLPKLTAWSQTPQ